MKFLLMTLCAVWICIRLEGSTQPEEQIFIRDLKFDHQTNEFKISYSSSNSNVVTTLQDSGGLYLCVINQLLKEYYHRMGETSEREKNPEFSKNHLKLISQLAAKIPMTESFKIRDSIRSYIQNFRKGGGSVLKALEETVVNSVQEDKILVLEETFFDPNEKRKLEEEIVLLNHQLKNSNFTQESDEPDMKSFLKRYYEKKLLKLSSVLKNYPTQYSKREKKILASESIFCSAKLPYVALMNSDVGELIETFSREIKSSPTEQKSETKSKESHL